MTSFSKLILGSGALLMCFGILAVGSALGESRDETVIAAGISAFSFGTLMISATLYVRARELEARCRAQKEKKGTACGACHKSAAVIRCTTHVVALCGDCLATHDQAERCLYVPLGRKFRMPRQVV